MQEIEVKLLQIDPEAIRQKLQDIGAKKVFDERLYKRIVFFMDGHSDQNREWIRLRDEVDKVTLTYKRQVSYAIDGMEELSVDVSDFQSTRDILHKMGLKEINYQENKREEWKTDDAIFEIDTWPLLPPFLEIEAEDKDIIERYIGILELSEHEQMFGGAGEVYMQKIGLNVDDYPVLTFNTKQ